MGKHRIQGQCPGCDITIIGLCSGWSNSTCFYVFTTLHEWEVQKKNHLQSHMSLLGTHTVHLMMIVKEFCSATGAVVQPRNGNK